MIQKLKISKALILLLVLTTVSFANGGDKAVLTGIVYKKFNLKNVQIKDEYGQILKIPRSAFPKNFKMIDGAVFSFEIDTEKLQFSK